MPKSKQVHFKNCPLVKLILRIKIQVQATSTLTSLTSFYH